MLPFAFGKYGDIPRTCSLWNETCACSSPGALQVRGPNRDACLGHKLCHVAEVLPAMVHAKTNTANRRGGGGPATDNTCAIWGNKHVAGKPTRMVTTGGDEAISRARTPFCERDARARRPGNMRRSTYGRCGRILWTVRREIESLARVAVELADALWDPHQQRQLPRRQRLAQVRQLTLDRALCRSGGGQGYGASWQTKPRVNT